MKKLATFILVLLMSQSVIADGNKSGRYMEKLAQHLDLQEDQVEVVKGIFQEQHEKRRALMKKMKAEMQVVHDETKNRLSAVLNDEQMEKYETMVAERKEKMKQRWEKHKDKRGESEAEEG